jgi:tetratricopeptide (TPR) repeat protein
MESCLNCGERLTSDAKFCAACGTRRGEASAREIPWTASPRRGGSALRALVIASSFVLGGALTAAVLGALHLRHPANHVTRPSRLEKPNSPIAGLPPGHPAVKLPTGHPGMPDTSRLNAVVAEAGKQAERSPKDIGAWNRYGDLAMRFAMFDPANYRKARAAFVHVLELDPGNTDALRGIGDVYYDTRQYSEAIDAYNRYLSVHKDDIRVRTDLGTMYLSQHNSAEAVKQYRMALVQNANFFPAQFDLAVAYLMRNDDARARDAFSKARTIAPDLAARTRIDEMIAKIDDKTVKSDTGGGTGSDWKTSNAKTVRQ